MCNIHFIMPIDKKLKKSDGRELAKMLETSAETNKDGFGIFTENARLKKPRQYKNTRYMVDKISQMVKGERFVIAHNRYTTSGKNVKENTHPIETKNLMYVHNGHISNYTDINKELTFDSDAIGYVIERELEYGNDIVTSIQNGLADLSGYLSVFIYYKPTKRLFYIVKDANFQFNLVTNRKGEKIIIGNTITENLNEFGSVKETELNFPIREYTNISKFPLYQNVIYEITKEKGIEDVGKFVLKPEPTYNWKTNTTGVYNYRQFDQYGNLYKSKEEINKSFDKMSITEMAQLIEDDLTAMLGKGIQVKETATENRFHIYGNRKQLELFHDLALHNRYLTINEMLLFLDEINTYLATEGETQTSYARLYNSCNGMIDLI